jgi:hypothetical protein
MKAELCWQFNPTNGSRASKMSDLDRLANIVRQVFDSLAALGIQDSCKDVLEVIEATKAFLGDSRNFRRDNRSMPFDSARKWVSLCDALKHERRLLRERCERALHFTGRNPAAPG